MQAQTSSPYGKAGLPPVFRLVMGSLMGTASEEGSEEGIYSRVRKVTGRRRSCQDGGDEAVIKLESSLVDYVYWPSNSISRRVMPRAAGGSCGEGRNESLHNCPSGEHDR